jgi:hypothetical protein
MDMIMIITNNPLLGDGERVVMKDSSEAVLMDARDMIHKGHTLLNHPKYGNIQPGQWMYRTLLVSKEKGALDVQSLNLIEDAIHSFDRSEISFDKLSSAQKRDYQLVDADIILAAIRMLCPEEYQRVLSKTGRG